MIRVALREIRAHLVRFLLSMLAVTLGISFVTGTFSLRTLLSDTFGSIIASTTQGDLYVRGPVASASDAEPAADAEPVADAPTAPPADAGTALPTDAGTALPSGTAASAEAPADEPEGTRVETLGAQRSPIPLDLVDDIERVDGVEQVAPDLLGTAVLIGAYGQAVVNGQAPSLGSALRGDDPSGTLLRGRVPSDASEIALETTAMETSGLDIGDVTQVVLGAGALTDVTVVGEVTYGNPMVGTTLVLVDAATGEASFAPNGRVPSIAVFLEEEADPGTVAEALRADLAHHDGIEVVTGEQVRKEANEAITQLLGFLGTFLLVFALISLFVGAFLISNTFAMSVRQRQREFALLRAVGASPGQVMVTVLGQAAAVGLVGSLVGLAGGIGLVAVVRVTLASLDMELAGQVVVTSAEAAWTVALGTGISMLAAAFPARRAATTPPVEAMRDDVVVVERSLRLRALVGAVLLLGGTASVLYSVQEGTGNAGTWLGVGSGAVLVGVLAVSPAIARAVVRVLALPFVVLLRPVGRLAQGNVMRNPRRTASTSGALMIGMALVGACAVLADSAQASTSSIVASESRADFWVQSATRTVPPDAATQIAALPEVGRADTVTTGRAPVTGPDGTEGTFRAAGLPADAFGETIEVEVVDGSLATLADGDVAIGRTAAVEEGWSVGEELTLAGLDGPRRARIAAVVASELLVAPVILDADDFATAVPDGQTAMLAVLVDAAPGVEPEALRDALDATVEPYVVLAVHDAEELTDALAEQVDQAMVILYALLGLSVIIAVLGIVNTLALAVIERTREIGLMRAVGLGRLQLAATITVESVLTAVFGTLLGVAVGVGLASAMPSVFADQGLTELAIPGDLLAVMVLVSGLVGVLAAVWPAARAANLPVLEAVTHD